VTLFETLQGNPTALDFSLLLPDIMTIADEADSQLTQTMDSYMNVVPSQRQRSSRYIASNIMPDWAVPHYLSGRGKALASGGRASRDLLPE
jgi:hypothetical protein